MKCGQANMLLRHYHQGELDDSETTRLQIHLDQCPACREAAREYRLLQSASAQARVPGPSEEFLEEFRQETVELARSGGTRRSGGNAWAGGTALAGSGPFKRRAARPPVWLNRWRFALAGAAVMAVIVLAVTYFSGRSVPPQLDLPTVDSYLARSDFRGLSSALDDPRHRRFLLGDTVSVALLLKSVDRMDRPATHASYLKKSAARALCDLMGEQSKPAGPGASLEYYQLDRTDVCANTIDLNEIQRALRRYRYSEKRIAVRDVVKVLSNSTES